MINQKFLNELAARRQESSSLLPAIKASTPASGLIHIGLFESLSEVIATLSGKELTGGIVIVADTLSIGTEAITLPSFPLQIIARQLNVEPDAQLIMAPDGVLQVYRSDQNNPIAVSFGSGDPEAVILPLIPGNKSTISSVSGNKVTPSTDNGQIADLLHQPWAILGLELSYTAAASLSQNSEDQSAMSMATKMLRWVSAGAELLLKHQNNFSGLDTTLIRRLRVGATTLLASTQSAATGVTYVPALSADMYETEIKSLLTLAEAYDQKISALKNAEQRDEALRQFATTLKEVNATARQPLFATLKRLNGQASALRTELKQLTLKLERTTKLLKPLQDELQDAKERAFQHELLMTALETLFTMAKLYVSIGAALVDPTFAEAGSEEAVKAAMDAAYEIAGELLEQGEQALTSAIESGMEAAGGVPSEANSAQVARGANAMVGAQLPLSLAMSKLWLAINKAISSGAHDIDFNTDLNNSLNNLSGLSQSSVGGVDATSFWDAAVVQVRATTRPCLGKAIVGPPAAAYLEVMELAATYGKGVGDLQAKLLDIYSQAIDAFNRLRAVDEAAAKWNALGGKLADDEQRLLAATGLLEMGFDGVRNSLLLAVNDYRAAFFYQWLEPSPLHIDNTMDYPELLRAGQDAETGLRQVLAQKAFGALRPQQKIDSPLTYYVRAENGIPLFTKQGDKGVATWTIPTSDNKLADQLNKNSAIFITEARFELEGVAQQAEVEMDITAGGDYENKRNGKCHRFVTSPVSMTVNYKPGSPPTYISTWKFADAASYLKPTPYTRWQLRVDQGNWEKVTAIKVTLTGVFLQNNS